MTTPAALHQTMHGFYKNPNAELAVEGLRQLLESGQLDNPSVFHGFARIADVCEAARTGFATLSSLHPQYVAAVLQGSRHPNFPRVDADNPKPEDLDLLWSEFLITGEPQSVLRIVAVLDWPDVVRERLKTWLRETGTGFWGRRTIAKFKPMLTRCAFPVDFETRVIDGPLDCDLQTAMKAKAGKLKFVEFPFVLSQVEVVRLATKFSAVWSLRSLATEHELVAQLCEVEAKRPGGAARMHLFPLAGA